jgi:hypothetical protein
MQMSALSVCPASEFCVDCNANFCNACIKVIHSPRSLSQHKIVSMSSKPLPVLRYLTHGNKKMKLFCETCFLPGCSLCASHGLHQGHKCRITETVAAEKRPLVESATFACNSQVKQLEEECASMAMQEQGLVLTQKEMLQKLREDLDFSWVAAAIESRRDTLSSELCAMVDARQQLLGKRRDCQPPGRRCCCFARSLPGNGSG